jgi:riboflavin biosynthesis pyrimidine reductase
MDTLLPLEPLFVREGGEVLPLTGALAQIFAPLSLHLPADPPYVIGNFVTTLDGVVSLDAAGVTGGGDISGFNRHDLALLGLLRATADAVIVGAGTMRIETQHLLTHEAVMPELQVDYQALRSRLGKTALPWNVIVTAHGQLDLSVPAFQGEKAPVVVVTTKRGLERLKQQTWLPSLHVVAAQDDGDLTAAAILAVVAEVCQGSVWLVEGGSHLMGSFLAEERLDELFLTLAPQIAGRNEQVDRPGFVAGQLFAPAHPLWSELAAVRRGGDHLFLRYRLKHASETK